jgi:hypothetical protein
MKESIKSNTRPVRPHSFLDILSRLDAIIASYEAIITDNKGVKGRSHQLRGRIDWIVGRLCRLMAQRFLTENVF